MDLCLNHPPDSEYNLAAELAEFLCNLKIKSLSAENKNVPNYKILWPGIVESRMPKTFRVKKPIRTRVKNRFFTFFKIAYTA